MAPPPIADCAGFHPEEHWGTPERYAALVSSPFQLTIITDKLGFSAMTQHAARLKS